MRHNLNGRLPPVPETIDVGIIGAGPAGLSAAVYAGRALLKTVVFEKKVVGGQIIEAYDVDNYPGFPDGITGVDLMERMLAHAQKFDVEVVNSGVREVELQDDLKRIVTDNGEVWHAPIAIVASGAYHRKLGVPGEQRLSGKGVSYCATCDGPFFRDKRLVVVGGGDAALTESIFLTRFASELKLVHRRQGFRGRPIHVEAARTNDRIEFVLDSVVTEIHGDSSVTGVTVSNVASGAEERMECEGVFVFIGHEVNTGFLKSVLPAHAGGIIPVDYNMETDVPGLYAIGDVRKGSYRQLGTAVGEGIMAAMHAEERIKQLTGGVH
jgi:thioredoxin reductase (NADPH)